VEPLAPAGSDQAVNDAVIWEKIAADFSKNSFIRFGWLRDGVFDRLAAGKIFIRFPESARESATSYFMEEGLKEIERRLNKEFDRPMKLEMEFDETLQAEPPVQENPEVREEPVAAKEIAPPAAEEPPAEHGRDADGGQADGQGVGDGAPLGLALAVQKHTDSSHGATALCRRVAIHRSVAKAAAISRASHGRRSSGGGSKGTAPVRGDQAAAATRAGVGVGRSSAIRASGNEGSTRAGMEAGSRGRVPQWRRHW
jgi:hypothetical protein